jgi:hypothetical protein
MVPAKDILSPFTLPLLILVVSVGVATVPVSLAPSCLKTKVRREALISEVSAVQVPVTSAANAGSELRTIRTVAHRAVRLFILPMGNSL